MVYGQHNGAIKRAIKWSTSDEIVYGLLGFIKRPLAGFVGLSLKPETPTLNPELSLNLKEPEA